MRRSKKISLIIIAATVAVLSGIYFIGYKGSGLGLKDELVFSRQEYTVSSSDIKGIDIADLDRNIRIVPSDDGDVHITYYTSDKITYTFETDADGKLLVTYSDNMRWYDNFRYIIKDKGSDITIAVPDGFAGDIATSVYKADQSVEDLDISGSLNIKTETGNISVSNVTSSGSITLSTYTGDVITNDVVSGGDFSNTQVTGGYVASNVSCGGAYKLDLTKGDINVSRLEGADLYLETANGSVTATIVGNEEDYAIESYSYLGTTTLTDKSDGTKKLEAYCMSENIDVSFVS